jgi:acetyltransferase-like isoleucine patch superfamily enzyme
MMSNPLAPAFLDEHDLSDAGFRAIGRNVRIDKSCSIIGPENIEIGNNVRIDGFCSIAAAGSGVLTIGSHIHIAAYVLLSAGGGIRLADFCGLSHGVRVYSRTDDFGGDVLTGPTIPAKYTGVVSGMVTVGRHVVVGSGSVILPRVDVGEGSAVGALSLVARSLDPWGIYVGCPARKVRDRSRRLLDLEAELMRDSLHVS